MAVVPGQAQLQGRALVAARSLLVTLWAGSVWTVGYLVAPTLFATLSDRVLAGTIAGAMFRTEAWLTFGCGLVLLGLFSVAKDFDARQRRILMLVVFAMIACTAVSHLGLQPMMAALRESAAGNAGVMDTAARSRFGMLHGVSAVLYLIQSVLAVVLVLKSQRPNP